MYTAIGTYCHVYCNGNALYTVIVNVYSYSYMAYTFIVTWPILSYLHDLYSHSYLAYTVIVTCPTLSLLLGLYFQCYMAYTLIVSWYWSTFCTTLMEALRLSWALSFLCFMFAAQIV